MAGNDNSLCHLPFRWKGYGSSFIPRLSPQHPSHNAPALAGVPAALPSHMHRKLVTEANGPACGHQRADNSSLSKGPFMSKPPTRPVGLKSPFVCPRVRACSAPRPHAAPRLLLLATDKNRCSPQRGPRHINHPAQIKASGLGPILRLFLNNFQWLSMLWCRPGNSVQKTSFH